MLAGVVLTALYMTRQIIYVFFGNSRAGSEHAHESPRVMTTPLIVLAICSILLGLVLTPAWPWLRAYLEGEPAHVDMALLFQPMLLPSLVLVASGILIGVLIYRSASEKDPLEQAQPALFRFFENKMGLDDLYEHTFIVFSRTAARVSDWMDRYFWDGLVRTFAGLGQLFGIFTSSFDQHGINAGVDETTIGARGLGRVLSKWHSGQIQTYLGVVAIGMLALLLLYAWLT
jgi:NADH-quinone oxidoreductase subunit L